MKIYLAATAPGNEIQRERGMLDIPSGYILPAGMNIPIQ